MMGAETLSSIRKQLFYDHRYGNVSDDGERELEGAFRGYLSPISSQSPCGAGLFLKNLRFLSTQSVLKNTVLHLLFPRKSRKNQKFDKNGRFEHQNTILSPLNTDFEPILLSHRNENEGGLIENMAENDFFRVIGVFVAGAL